MCNRSYQYLFIVRKVIWNKQTRSGLKCVFCAQKPLWMYGRFTFDKEVDQLSAPKWNILLYRYPPTPIQGGQGSFPWQPCMGGGLFGALFYSYSYSQTMIMCYIVHKFLFLLKTIVSRKEPTISTDFLKLFFNVRLLKYTGHAGPDCKKLRGPTECLFCYLSVKR